MKHVNEIFSNWSRTEFTYCLYLPGQLHWSFILIIGILISSAWKKFPKSFKYHTYMAAAINIPLYLIACWPGELRNLSLLYPTLWMLIGFYIKENIPLVSEKGDEE